MIILAANIDAAHRRKILVVDDSRDFADTLAKLLTQRGYEVRVAYSGPQGLDLAVEFEPEAIICDLVMPEMSGYELARSLRGDRELSAILLVAVTGFVTADAERRARRVGFDGFLAKPIEGDDLVRLFERMRWRSDHKGPA
jgi:CheY-like chemotaxis protein